MSRLTNTYLAPDDSRFASMTPVLPMEALGEVLNRVSAAIPQGAWLEGSPDLLLDRCSNTLKLKLTDGSFVTLDAGVFDLGNARHAAPRQNSASQDQADKPRQPHCSGSTGSESRPVTEKNGTNSAKEVRAVAYSLDTRGVQTSEADIPIGQGHESLIFPAIEEMVQAITAAENRASYKRP